MSDFKFPSKLTDYLKKIEMETGREVKILESSHLGLKGIWAAFRYHPDFIVIIIHSSITKTNEDLERSIAHEAAHGYILFKKGYCRPVFKFSASTNHRKYIQLLFTMVDDIVVNKIIQDNGFPPFGSEYLPMVKKEIKAAISREDFYSQFSDDILFDRLLMVSRYIIAWGFLYFFNLKHDEQEIIGRFTEVFQRLYPKEYQTAYQIKEIIIQNDIFTSNGHCNAMHDILKYLKLENSVKIENIG